MVAAVWSNAKAPVPLIASGVLQSSLPPTTICWIVEDAALDPGTLAGAMLCFVGLPTDFLAKGVLTCGAGFVMGAGF